MIIYLPGFEVQWKKQMKTFTFRKQIKLQYEKAEAEKEMKKGQITFSCLTVWYPIRKKIN